MRLSRFGSAPEAVRRLALEAARLRRDAARAPARLPALLFITDPARVVDPVAAAARLPQGSGVVFRSFGAAAQVEVGLRLAALARARGLTLLVGADPQLAQRLGADGVHLPERDLPRAAALRRRRPDWILTGAAHTPGAVRRGAALGLDAMLLSPVFASRSPSAVGAAAWGALRAARIAAAATVPVYALGGVSDVTARRLRVVAGLAAVGALAQEG